MERFDQGQPKFQPPSWCKNVTLVALDPKLNSLDTGTLTCAHDNPACTNTEKDSK